MPDDWTTLLTEEERNWLKVAQAYIPKAIALRVAGMDPKAGETEAVVIEFARSLAALRAEVAEKDAALAGLLDVPHEEGCTFPQGGMYVCTRECFRRSRENAHGALALTEADMLKRLEVK